MKKRSMFWKMVTSSLSRRKSRMITALLAIAMGATILSGLVTIYYDIPRQLGKEFRSYGANLIVMPKDSDKKIVDSKLEIIKNSIGKDKIVGVAPYIYENAKINEQPYMIAGTDIDGAKSNYPYWLVNGNWPKDNREILIGEKIADQIGLKDGDKITINTPKKEGGTKATDFVVTGIVTTGGKEEELIFMSLSDIREIVGQRGFDVIECSIDIEHDELENIVKKISSFDDSLTPRIVKRVTQSQDLVLTKLQALIWIVTVIVLGIMMICVSTTMMAVVTERRKEIGLKKALGASNKAVILDFLGEGVLLGAFGGFLGIFLGYLFAQKVSISVFARRVSFLWQLVPFTIIVSIIITIVACLIPVRKAMDVEPALVLRGE